MEVLVFGHVGLPVIIFPTSCGRFFEFEDRGMINAISDKLEHGQLQLFCVDSVDAESWYNRVVSPRSRIARHVQYEQYLMNEFLPFIQATNGNPNLATVGCSFGGYHAMNIALRHPDVFHVVLSLGGVFNPAIFLDGYYDDDCYFNLPMHFLPNLNDTRILDRYRSNNYTLVTGEDDMCRHENEQMAQVLKSKEIPYRLDVWGDGAGHDWTWWQNMLQNYLND
jgi:esterase/lipase superfamily enzyme